MNFVLSMMEPFPCVCSTLGLYHRPSVNYPANKSSGTTGHPKACPFPTERAGGLVGGRAHSLGLESGPNGDRWYICMPLYHGTGYTTAVSCVLSGITLCLGKKFSTSRFWSEVRDSKSTAF